ncbi:MAG TPA: hypothetical protein VMA54_04915 [Steroidobacteraceae bacterium]|nr:hypothetical protein [Steroidobacteraceae bacterium]
MLITFAVAMVVANAVVMAEDFGDVHYDAKGDQIIVTVTYDGTNPNHHFSIRWGRCQNIHDQLHGPARKIVDVGILDDQGNDAAIKSYTETVRVPLAGLSCRPATVTLWAPPNSSTSVDIP